MVSFTVLWVIGVRRAERREQEREQERKRRHAEFDELEPGKMYNPADYWELFK